MSVNYSKKDNKYEHSEDIKLKKLHIVSRLTILLRFDVCCYKIYNIDEGNTVDLSNK